MNRLEKMEWHRDGEGSVPLEDLDLLLRLAREVIRWDEDPYLSDLDIRVIADRLRDSA